MDEGDTESNARVLWIPAKAKPHEVKRQCETESTKGCLSFMLGPTLPDGAKAYPGYEKYRIITPEVWYDELAAFSLNSTLQIMNLQAAAFLTASLFTSETYVRVPFQVRVLYLLAFAVSILLQAFISFRTAMQHSRGVKNHAATAQSKFLLQRSLLEWLAPPANVIHAPGRFMTAGTGSRKSNPDAKNYAVPSEFPYPIIRQGAGATFEYQDHQSFPGSLPRVFFNDMLCFSINVYMSVVYLDSFTLASGVSAFFHVVSLCKKCYDTLAFVKSVRLFRQWNEELLLDRDPNVEREKVYARAALQLLQDRLPRCVIGGSSELPV